MQTIIRSRAFTLFEVAISLALVAFAVTSMLLLFVSGIKTQQIARFKLYAAAKAEEMVESFASTANANPNIEVEGPSPWEVQAGYRALSPDLEIVVASHRYGIAALPTRIARRLDSDHDEIQRVLDNGGQIYFAQPMATTGIEEVSLPVAQASEAQKLVFAVTGFAQQNAVAFLPWKSWPYYMPYPSPPGHGYKKLDQYMAPDTTGMHMITAWGHPAALWEGVGSGGLDDGIGTTDGEIKVVWQHDIAGVSFGFRPYAYGSVGDQGLAYATAPAPGTAAATLLLRRDACIRYIQAALWYCKRKGLGTNFFAPSPAPAAKDVGDFEAGVERWKQVMAMRFLAHAATCATRWWTHAELTGSGLAIAAVSGFPSEPSPQIALTHDLIVYYHERCLNLAMRFAAESPYDWAVPRPTQRPIMMDYPLVQWDLWSSQLPPGPIVGAPGRSATQWRPIAAQRPTNIGRSYQYPDRSIDPAIWGDQDNFTLAKPFAASERCRQIVFWAVDWTSYVDFETAPSAPVDASKYLFAAPLVGKTFAQRMTWDQWTDHHVYAFRNPEKNLAFKQSVGPPYVDGMDVSGLLDKNAMYAANDHGTSPNQLGCFIGAFGADRNFNKQLDLGPVPESVRMRAISVGRYNYYDPILTMVNR
ncbi:MAG: hypothetical protein H0X45_00740 [Planctomycetes bacterium]|nr:hypothetical protein [Planctomycetota bacterium]